MQNIFEKFREEYKKAYQGILTHPQLNKGNEWFEAFIKSEVEGMLEEIKQCEWFNGDVGDVVIKTSALIEIAKKHGFNINI